MKSVYLRTQLTITEFDKEDVIATSGDISPVEPTVLKKAERENRYGSFDTFDLKPPTGNWF